MAKIGHRENRDIAISQRKKTSNFDKIWYIAAHLELDDSHVIKYYFFVKFKMADDRHI